MTREEITAVFERMADIMQIIGDDDPNRIRLYRNIAITLSNELPDELNPPFNKYDLPKMKGVGTSTIDKIAELVDTGTCQSYEELKASIPSGVLDLLDISGVGPSTASKLYHELGIESLEILQEALDTQKLRGVKGMGKKTEENIRQGLEALLRHRQIRLMGYVLPVVQSIVDDLNSLAKNISIIGDLRRKTEVIREAGIIMSDADAMQVRDAMMKHESVNSVSEMWSDDEVSAQLVGDVKLHIIIRDDEHFGESLLFLTGSKSHIDGLNERAKQIGKNPIGSLSHVAMTETEIYQSLQMPFIVPELREGSGEIGSAISGDLPKLIELGDIKGDLHVHSTWSDGHESI